MSLDAEDTAVETALHSRRDWKGYAAMLMAVMAVVSTFRKQPEDAAKAGYIEHTEAILDCQRASIRNHEDIVSLSESLEGYMKGHTVIETIVPASSAGAAPEVWTPAPSKPVVPKVVHVVASPSAAPVPPIAPLPAPREVKSADKISW